MTPITRGGEKGKKGRRLIPLPRPYFIVWFWSALLTTWIWRGRPLLIETRMIRRANHTANPHLCCLIQGQEIREDVRTLLYSQDFKPAHVVGSTPPEFPPVSARWQPPLTAPLMALIFQQSFPLIRTGVLSSFSSAPPAMEQMSNLHMSIISLIHETHQTNGPQRDG